MVINQRFAYNQPALSLSLSLVSLRQSRLQRRLKVCVNTMPLYLFATLLPDSSSSKHGTYLGLPTDAIEGLPARNVFATA